MSDKQMSMIESETGKVSRLYEQKRMPNKSLVRTQINN